MTETLEKDYSLSEIKALVEKDHSLSEIKTLVEKEFSGIKTVEVVEFPLLLHPSYSNNIGKGIKNFLNGLKSTYHDKLNGVLMGYENIKVVHPGGWLLDTNPYLQLLISGTFYVFCPASGSIVEGVVSKKFGDHVSCLVHNKFNVTSWRKRAVDWCGYNVNKGDVVKLNVKHVSMNLYLPYIKATIDPTSVPIRVKQEVKVKTGEKNKKIIFNDDDSGVGTNDCLDTSSNNKRLIFDSDSDSSDDGHHDMSSGNNTESSSNSSDHAEGKIKIKKEKKKKKKKNEVEKSKLGSTQGEIVDNNNEYGESYKKKKKIELAGAVKIRTESIGRNSDYSIHNSAKRKNKNNIVVKQSPSSTDDSGEETRQVLNKQLINIKKEKIDCSFTQTESNSSTLNEKQKKRKRKQSLNNSLNTSNDSVDTTNLNLKKKIKLEKTSPIKIQVLPIKIKKECD